MILTAILTPIANIIMLPINLVTFNFTSWLVHIVLFYVFMILTPQVSLNAWNFPGINLGPFELAPINLGYIEMVVLVGLFFVILSRFIEWLRK